MTATISVVCPTFNAKDYIENTLACLLEQVCAPHEIVFADDASTDDTVSVLRAWAPRFEERGICFKILKNTHAGPGENRNRGLRVATGDWIAFLDADDSWTENKLARVSEEIAAHPEANFITHWENYVRLDGSVSPLIHGDYDPNTPPPREIYRICKLSTSAITCRRDIIEQVGGFDPTLPVSQDYELWLRLSPFINMHVIKEVLGQYREVPGSITAKPYWKRYPPLIRILWRHRAKGGFGLFFYRAARATLSRQWLASLVKFFQKREGH